MPSAPAAHPPNVDPSADPSSDKSATVNFAQVFASEAMEIEAQCRLRGVNSDLRLMPQDGRPLIPDRLGLAFSGGGIRSACVALGVLQSLARARILRQVHYISGISGGGYALAWLTAWTHRAKGTGLASGRGALATVEQQLANNSDSGSTEPVANLPEYRRHIEPFPLHYLRRYSSYLNPRSGLLSGDTLAMVSIYLRNVLLNQVMLGCAALAILLLLQFPAFLHRTPDIFPDHTGTRVSWYGLLLPDAFFWPCVVLLLVTFIASIIFSWNSVRGLQSPASSKTSSPCDSPQPTPPADPNTVKKTSKPGRDQAFWAILLGVIACTSVWLLLPRLYAKYPNSRATLWGSVVLVIIGLAITVFHNLNDNSAVERTAGGRIFPLVFAWSAVFIAALGLQFAFHGWILAVCTEPERGSYLVFGLPALLVAVSLQVYLWVGIMGNAFPDSRREWLGRASGYLLACAVAIAILFFIAYFGPLCMHLLFTGFRGGGWKKTLASFGITGGWLGTVLTGILGGRSARTSSQAPRNETSPKILNAIVLLAPPIFILGVLLCASFASHALVRRIVSNNSSAIYCDRDYLPCADWRAAPSTPRLVWGSPDPDLIIQKPDKENTLGSVLENICPTWRYALLITLFVIVAAILAWRLDVNEFSLHLFYRNRLVRAFLGASRPEKQGADGQDPRDPNPFTGFAFGDDIALQCLIADHGFEGPYPIWGTCLNLTTGEDLAFQQRKGASFIYSPLHSGWDYVNRFDPPRGIESPESDPDQGRKARQDDTLSKFGYRSNLPSGPNGDIPGYGGVGGTPWIGTAMAASGAAVSPNSGYHTSAGVAALLTLFNVRLGWWTGNPRHPRLWKKYAPGIWYLLKELRGEATDRAGYVYLSDGGHFENLGIYELVRRHVRFIICSDADADPQFAFGDLGNAIDRCRRDFGVEIKIKAQTQIAAGARKGFRGAHYAVGEICYPGQAQRGLLLYIKSSLTSDEPGDVLGMKASDKAFPHDTTLNQFFDEKKFEAYRALGQHMMDFILQPRDANGRISAQDRGTIPMTLLDPNNGDTAAARVHRLFNRLYAQLQV